MERLTNNWSVYYLVQVAKAKGGSKIIKWDSGNHLQGIIDQWEGDDGLRPRFF